MLGAVVAVGALVLGAFYMMRRKARLKAED
jgi:uncharacterized membrane protein